MTPGRLPLGIGERERKKERERESVCVWLISVRPLGLS